MIRSKFRTDEKESDIQRLILDWLAAEKIWHMRLNAGAMAGAHKGKKWFVRFGKPGMADILAVKMWAGRSRSMIERDCPEMLFPMAVWIEVKAAKGIQSPDQKAFQAEVEARGMVYILARSLDEVIEGLR
jgi:hypothetical protein